MAVYCEPLSDEKIFDQLGHARRVLIIGCPSCPAIWYTLDGGSPTAAVTITGIQSISVKNEIDRLTQLLIRKSVLVESWITKIPEHLCEINRDCLRKVSKQYQCIDAIIVLGCKAGKENIEDSFRDVKTICGLKARGLISFPLVRKLNKFFPDRTNVSIHPFQFLPE